MFNYYSNMCGIVGCVFRHMNCLGESLVSMADALQHRGRDSAGFAIYGSLNLLENEYLISVEVLNKNTDVHRAIAAEIKSHTVLSPEIHIYKIFASSFEHVQTIVKNINSLDGVKVLGAGKFEMIKDLGLVNEIDSRFKISGRLGTHGLAHVRFSTESVIDRFHAHPFQSHVYPDITVVHNGQITNCIKLRRRLEAIGHDFSTDNDTEVIVHYVADKLFHGYTLDEALSESLRDMDGPFTYIIATDSGIGIVKDNLALRPGIIYETKDMFCAASEKVALERFSRDGPFEVLSNGEYRTFEVKK